MLQDLKFGLKMLWREKAFTLAALLTLALCIGANTAIFTVLKAVVLEPLPFAEPDRLVTVYNAYPGVGVDRGSNSVPDQFDREKMTDVFDSVASMAFGGFDVGSPGSITRVNAGIVTPSYFKVLRLNPALGRPFTAEDAQVGKDHSVILTHALWKDMFNSDPGVIGRDLRLSGVPYKVVGVMPATLDVINTDAKLILPLAFKPEQTTDDARHSNSWEMIARLQPGVTLQRAQQRIDSLNISNLDRTPKYKQLLLDAKFCTRVLNLKDEMVRDVRPMLWLVQAAVGFVLLIGCVNVANLMLVRANVRMKELAIRFSLGADRWRIARQLLTESVTLAVLGGVLGIAVGLAAIQGLIGFASSRLPLGTTIRMDFGVLAFSIALAVLTGLVFGTFPALHVVRRDLNDTFRQNGRTGTSDRHAVWTRSALVVAQVSIAFVLLVGSALLTLSFSRLLTVNPGFNPDRVITARISLPESRYKDDSRARGFLTSLVDRVTALPGVKHAGFETCLPFSGCGNASAIEIPGRPLGPGEPPPVPSFHSISPGYLAAMGIPVLQGRGFLANDGPDSPKIVLIDEFLARKYWPKGDAVGHKIKRGVDEDKDLWTIAGVVGTTKTRDLTEKTVGQLYFPYTMTNPRTAHLAVKMGRDTASVAGAIRRIVQEADAELAVFDVKSMPELVAGSVTNRKIAMWMCGGFALLALLLSAIGIYGVLAYAVTQRTREFGIRVALGAGARELVGMVLGQGLKLAVGGLSIGIVGAMALTRLIGSLLFNVKPGDPGAYAAVAAMLLVIAGTAALIPSLRVLRIRPAEALRSE
jgi:predicted permease